LFKQSRCMKAIAGTVTAVFLYSFVLYEPLAGVTAIVRDGAEVRDAAGKIEGFVLPYRYGRVMGGNYRGSERLVVYIQDLHCNAEVQRNIFEIIKLIDERYGVNRIYVEGAPGGKVDTSILGSIPGGVRDRVLDSMIGKGLLSGAGNYAVRKGQDKLYGLEDWGVYIRNLERIQKLLGAKDGNRQVSEGLQARLREVKGKFLAEDLKRLEKRLAPRDGEETGVGKSSWTDVFKGNPEQRYLNIERMGRKVNESVSDYPNLAQYIEMVKLNRELNYRRLPEELRGYVEELKRVMPYGAYQALAQKLSEGNREEEYYLALAEAGRRYGREMEVRYPRIGKFLRYVNLNYRINPIYLVAEERGYGERVLNKNAKRLVDKEILFLSKMGKIFGDMVGLKVTPEEFAYFRENADRFRVLLQKYIPYDELGPVVKILDDKEILSFYDTNLERNGIFLQQMAAGQVSRNGSGSAAGDWQAVVEQLNKFKAIDIVVTGGFHSGVTKMLDERDVSYLAITPNVTKKYDENVYDKVITGKIEPNDIAGAAFSPADVDVMLGMVKEGVLDDPAGQKNTLVEVLGLLVKELAVKRVPEDAARDTLAWAEKNKLLEQARLINDDKGSVGIEAIKNGMVVRITVGKDKRVNIETGDAVVIKPFKEIWDNKSEGAEFYDGYMVKNVASAKSVTLDPLREIGHNKKLGEEVAKYDQGFEGRGSALDEREGIIAGLVEQYGNKNAEDFRRDVMQPLIDAKIIAVGPATLEAMKNANSDEFIKIFIAEGLSNEKIIHHLRNPVVAWVSTQRLLQRYKDGGKQMPQDEIEQVNRHAALLNESEAAIIVLIKKWWPQFEGQSIQKSDTRDGQSQKARQQASPARSSITSIILPAVIIAVAAFASLFGFDVGAASAADPLSALKSTIDVLSFIPVIPFAVGFIFFGTFMTVGAIVMIGIPYYIISKVVKKTTNAGAGVSRTSSTRLKSIVLVLGMLGLSLLYPVDALSATRRAATAPISAVHKTGVSSEIKSRPVVHKVIKSPRIGVDLWQQYRNDTIRADIRKDFMFSNGKARGRVDEINAGTDNLWEELSVGGKLDPFIADTVNKLGNTPEAIAMGKGLLLVREAAPDIYDDFKKSDVLLIIDDKLQAKGATTSSWGGVFGTPEIIVNGAHNYGSFDMANTIVHEFTHAQRHPRTFWQALARYNPLAFMRDWVFSDVPREEIDPVYGAYTKQSQFINRFGIIPINIKKESFFDEVVLIGPYNDSKMSTVFLDIIGSLFYAFGGWSIWALVRKLRTSGAKTTGQRGAVSVDLVAYIAAASGFSMLIFGGNVLIGAVSLAAGLIVAGISMYHRPVGKNVRLDGSAGGVMGGMTTPDQVVTLAVRDEDDGYANAVDMLKNNMENRPDIALMHLHAVLVAARKQQLEGFINKAVQVFADDLAEPLKTETGLIQNIISAQEFDADTLKMVPQEDRLDFAKYAMAVRFKLYIGDILNIVEISAMHPEIFGFNRKDMFPKGLVGNGARTVNAVLRPGDIAAALARASVWPRTPFSGMAPELNGKLNLLVVSPVNRERGEQLLLERVRFGEKPVTLGLFTSDIYDFYGRDVDEVAFRDELRDISRGAVNDLVKDQLAAGIGETSAYADENRIRAALNAVLRLPDLFKYVAVDDMRLDRKIKALYDRARDGNELERHEMFALNRALLQAAYPNGTRLSYSMSVSESLGTSVVAFRDGEMVVNFYYRISQFSEGDALEIFMQPSEDAVAQAENMRGAAGAVRSDIMKGGNPSPDSIELLARGTVTLINELKDGENGPHKSVMDGLGFGGDVWFLELDPDNAFTDAMNISLETSPYKIDAVYGRWDSTKKNLAAYMGEAVDEYRVKFGLAGEMQRDRKKEKETEVTSVGLEVADVASLANDKLPAGTLADLYDLARYINASGINRMVVALPSDMLPRVNWLAMVDEMVGRGMSPSTAEQVRQSIGTLSRAVGNNAISPAESAVINTELAKIIAHYYDVDPEGRAARRSFEDYIRFRGTRQMRETAHRIRADVKGFNLVLDLGKISGDRTMYLRQIEDMSAWLAEGMSGIRVNTTDLSDGMLDAFIDDAGGIVGKDPRIEIECSLATMNRMHNRINEKGYGYKVVVAPASSEEMQLAARFGALLKVDMAARGKEGVASALRSGSNGVDLVAGGSGADGAILRLPRAVDFNAVLDFNRLFDLLDYLKSSGMMEVMTPEGRSAAGYRTGQHMTEMMKLSDETNRDEIMRGLFQIAAVPGKTEKAIVWTATDMLAEAAASNDGVVIGNAAGNVLELLGGMDMTGAMKGTVLAAVKSVEKRIQGSSDVGIQKLLLHEIAGILRGVAAGALYARAGKGLDTEMPKEKRAALEDMLLDLSRYLHYRDGRVQMAITDPDMIYDVLPALMALLSEGDRKDLAEDAIATVERMAGHDAMAWLKLADSFSKSGEGAMVRNVMDKLDEIKGYPSKNVLERETSNEALVYWINAAEIAHRNGMRLPAAMTGISYAREVLEKNVQADNTVRNEITVTMLSTSLGEILPAEELQSLLGGVNEQDARIQESVRQNGDDYPRNILARRAVLKEKLSSVTALEANTILKRLDEQMDMLLRSVNKGPVPIALAFRISLETLLMDRKPFFNAEKDREAMRAGFIESTKAMLCAG